MSIKGLDPNAPASDGLAGLGDDELRALKAALQACFGGPTGSGLDGAITNDATATFPTAAEWSGLFSRMTALEGGGSTTIPLGAILMWSGTVGSIPSGWALCDGTLQNGQQTPDLRNKFVVGGGSSFDPGDEPASPDSWSTDSLTTSSVSGGTISVSIDDHVPLTEAHLPEHYHYVAYGNSGTPNAGDADGTRGVNFRDGGGDAEYRMKKTSSDYTTEEPNVGRSSPYGAASPTVLTHSGTATLSGGHSHVYTPPFYALAFIMYVGA